MSSFNYVILTIFGCGLATWLSRTIPFIMLKKFELPKPLIEYLSFIPVVIMSALWFSSLFEQNIGHFPIVKVENLIASLPTVIAAILTKNLLIIVLVGIISLALIQTF